MCNPTPQPCPSPYPQWVPHNPSNMILPHTGGGLKKILVFKHKAKSMWLLCIGNWDTRTVYQNSFNQICPSICHFRDVIEKDPIKIFNARSVPKLKNLPVGPCSGGKRRRLAHPCPANDVHLTEAFIESQLSTNAALKLFSNWQN